MATGRPSRHARAFDLLLSLYPAEFRDDYGRELSLVFRDRYRDSTGIRDRTRLWIEALAGIAAEAPKEHARMILQDVRYALRMLRKHLLVSTTIILTLALGIGVNTAIFSLVNAVVLRPLPVPAPDELSILRGPSTMPARHSGPMFERFRQAPPDGASVAAMSRVARVYVRTADAIDSERAALQLVSSNYFATLRVRPALGRFFDAGGGEVLDATPSAIVSHAYWQRRLGGRADIVGRVMSINGAAFTVVGVAPASFTGVWLESPVDVWVPLAMQHAVKYSQNYSASAARTNEPWLPQERIWWLDVIVRSPAAQEAAALAALNQTVKAVRSDTVDLHLEPFVNGFSTLRQQFTAPLYTLGAMAALVLLVTCANVANLLLARATGLRREIALRMSLGARRSRLLQQLLVESMLLVAAAAAAALVFARWAGDLLVQTATAATSGPAPFAPDLDLRVLGFTAVIATAAVLLFGVLPAWRATRVNIAGALTAAARGSSAAASAHPARLLVVAQVAVSLVLVAVTGLVARGFNALLHVDLGFDREHVLSVAIDPRLAGVPPRSVAEMQLRVLEEFRIVPGVQSAALAMCGLQSGCRSLVDSFRIEGYQQGPDEKIAFLVNAVSSDYFSTVGMRLIAGRPLTERDTRNGSKVAVVNRSLASKYFPDGDAVGRRFGDPSPDTEIVGIVEDARTLNVKEAAVPSAFFPIEQSGIVARQLELRTVGEPARMTATVRATFNRVAPTLPIESITTVDERVLVGLSRERLIVLLASGFGTLALGLSGFGLFGLLSYAVSRRVSEFGIRMALGAPRSQVVWSVVREAMILVACGLAVGLPLVLMSGGLISSLFTGVDAQDWPVLAAAAATLTAAGLVASAWPAIRASRVDPIVALRQE